MSTTAVSRSSDGDESVSRQLVQWLAGLGLAAGVALAVVAFSSVRVCDQQLSSKGTAVRICRHLQTTDPPVIAVALIMLAGLGAFFTEIAGLGFSLKREVRQASERAEEATAKAEKAREEVVTTTDELMETVGDLADLNRVVVERAAPAPLASEPEEEEEEHPESPDAHLDTLAADYNLVRLKMPRGLERTRAMTRIAENMRDVVGDAHTFDARANLASGDRGHRLAAYAYLLDHAKPEWTDDLVRSLLDVEDKPFGQFRALRALRKQWEEDPTALTAEMRRRLEEELRPRLPPGDRTRELAKILAESSPSR